VSDKYLLNDDHSVRPTDDLLEWARAFETMNRLVAEAEPIAGIRVSTVFLGLDHSFGDGPPRLFETMIFGGEHDGDQWRYSTWAEAEAGHARAVALVGEGVSPA
jgi:hypothetical protein